MNRNQWVAPRPETEPICIRDACSQPQPKGTMKIARLLILTVTLALTHRARAQIAPSFTAASATEEGAIKLTWQSETNTYYRLEFATDLIDPGLGGPIWHTLYDDYPAHIGTNTFILDTGNYFPTPAVPHPKYSSTRYYRIANAGTNTAANPTVVITSP